MTHIADLTAPSAAAHHSAAPPPRSLDELTFHRQALANPRHRWWRPLLTILISVVIYAALVAVLLAGTVLSSSSVGDVLADGELDMSDPGASAVALMSLALMIPSLAIGVRLGERRRLGAMSSIAGRLRLNLLGRYSLVALVCIGLALGVSLIIDLLGGTVPRPAWESSSLGLLACALLLVPFQAAAEEYVFRALPQQVLGAWLRSPWWGILLPVPLFVVGHDYDLTGQLGVAAFAIAAGILTWRTGGLEAAIALHVVNNALLYVVGAFGLTDLNATSSSWPALGIGLAAITLYCVLVLKHQADADDRRT